MELKKKRQPLFTKVPTTPRRRAVGIILLVLLLSVVLFAGWVVYGLITNRPGSTELSRGLIVVLLLLVGLASATFKRR